ncbi:MAG TPA: hypothetical protein VF795_01585 [Desulfuromonadaceae bacterium]
MTMPDPPVETIKQFCVRNLSLKLLSLAVALCIWSFTAVSRESRYELTLPVELRNIPPGYAVRGQAPGEIRFTLAGPSLLIDGARRSNATVILNLRGAAVPGKTIFSRLESYLKLPEGVKVTRISPASLEIDLAREQIQSSSPQGEQQP